MNAKGYLEDLSNELRTEYEATRRVMSFDAYLETFQQSPRAQMRNAAQYLLDCFEHFGSEVRWTPLGKLRHWKLFDAEWEAGRDRLVGQEAVQNAVYRSVQNFIRQRRVNKLILLHGPNGSSKSSLIAGIGRALEVYSHTDEGALYSFGWVFPSRKVSKKPLGFGGRIAPAGAESVASFAHLDEEDIDATIPSDLVDHPLLLLPLVHRRQLLLETAERLKKEEGASELHIPDSLLYGELSPRNQQIGELLFSSYDGDLRRVLRHVQVKRFFVSRRFRRAAVTVEPQIHVDASVRQLTGDRSLASLPLILQSTTLYEPFGDLVDAQRGYIEYNDMLKRPIDSFKYLLATCEKSSVALQNQILFLDMVFFGSSNETHLAAFKEYPDFPAFKGRIDLIQVPYLRSYLTEREIYDSQLPTESLNKRIAPHATMVAALWAVLTRLRRPKADTYPKDLRHVLGGLTPLQKADLYATGRPPAGLPLDKGRLLAGHVEELAAEVPADGRYEGQIGASPREMKLVLLGAAQREEFETVSPSAVLAEIEELCNQKSLYAFLRESVDGKYNDPKAFVAVVRDRWLELADEELTVAMGLVTTEQYEELFQRYLHHVSHLGRGEKLLNPVTGSYEEPDERFMVEMETHFKVKGDAKTFRSGLLGRIGASSQDGPVGPREYRVLFPDLFQALEESYYARQKVAIRKTAQDMLRILADEGHLLDAGARRRAEQSMATLKERFGYCDPSAHEMLSALMSERLKGD